MQKILDIYPKECKKLGDHDICTMLLRHVLKYLKDRDHVKYWYLHCKGNQKFTLEEVLDRIEYSYLI